MKMSLDEMQTIGAPELNWKGSSGERETFHAEFVAAGGTPSLSRETASLLRGRLKAASAMLVAVFLLIAARNFLLSGWSPRLLIYLIGILWLSSLGALVYARSRLQISGLRLVESVTVGSVAVLMGVTSYLDLMGTTGVGEQETLIAKFSGLWIPYVWLALIYAMFIPNDWKRAAKVIIPVLLVPVVVRVAVRAQVPMLEELFSLDELSANLLVFSVTAASAVFGTYVINSLREEAFEGRKLGQYHLTERIGSGGMGEVWKARHQLLARPAAVKLIKPEMLGADTAHLAGTILKRFEREAQATAALRSPHSIVLYDFGTTGDGTFYYVMELLDGLDLETYVDRFGTMPAARVAHIMCQACESLEDAHRRGLIHRDIKPANIYICRLGPRVDFVKVLDFGLVKTQEQSVVEESAKLTQVGLATGTPAFMSPEQALAENVDGRSDLYSLACVGYWMLTGRLLFDSSSALAIAIDHVKTAPQKPSEKSEREIPRDFEDILMQCLQKDPNARPANAALLAGALKSCSAWSDWDERRAESWWEVNQGLGPAEI